MQKPRILFFANYSDLYGANRSMLTLLEYLNTQGYELMLLLPKHGDIEQVLQKKGIKYKVIYFFSQLFYYKWQLKYLSLPILWIITFVKIPAIFRFAQQYKPDIIYSNTSAENIGIYIARWLGCKHIWHIREFMKEDHGALFISGQNAKRKFINKSDGVIYVSHAVAESMEQRTLLAENKVVIYNGIHCELPCCPRGLHEGVNFGVVGILDRSKGQDMAIRYFSRILQSYPNATLHLWGDKDGKYKKYLHKMVKELSLENKVFFHGFEKDANKIYRDMHALLMCSRSEGFGRVTIEAMQRSIPVIGYSRGGTIELIENGQNGFLFYDEESFYDAVGKMFFNEQTYRRLSENAYHYATTKFTDEIYCSEVEHFILKIARCI